MIALSFSQAAAAVKGQLVGADSAFSGLCTDSRNPGHENLFVALAGPRFDGHDYVEGALEAGCAGALVDRWMDVDAPLIVVDDPLHALGRLAHAWRARFALRLAAITGSNGKTTVKNMLASILQGVGSTLATRGNLNNEIGVPLTLARLAPEHAAAVIEMGAAKAGDIAYLCGLAAPQVGVVTNASGAHLEGFGSIRGVAEAKGEMFSALPTDGVAVVNVDDEFHELWLELAGSRTVLTFGTSPDADVGATAIESGRTTAFTLRINAQEASVKLQAPGSHNVRNALAAAAAALALGVDMDAICRGLESFQPEAGRLTPRRAIGGWTLLDDAYNANPASLRAGILAAREMGGEVWVALGDMAELGPDSDALHFEAGLHARRQGVTRLFTLGARARHTAAAFGDGAASFETADALAQAVRDAIHPGVILLVKGSRRMHMEDVCTAVLAGAEQES